MIDGTEKGRWDGVNTVWSKAEYVVPAGAHIFKWVYEKDGNVSDGDDCAYLDFIMFPPSIKVVVNIEENSKNASGLSCNPNPANGLSHISFNLNTSSVVSLKLIDINGKIVENFIDNQSRKEGEYNMLINMAKYTAGVYYITLTTGNERFTEKIVIIK